MFTRPSIVHVAGDAGDVVARAETRGARISSRSVNATTPLPSTSPSHGGEMSIQLSAPGVVRRTSSCELAGAVVHDSAAPDEASRSSPSNFVGMSSLVDVRPRREAESPVDMPPACPTAAVFVS